MLPYEWLSGVKWLLIFCKNSYEHSKNIRDLIEHLISGCVFGHICLLSFWDVHCLNATTGYWMLRLTLLFFGVPTLWRCSVFWCGNPFRVVWFCWHVAVIALCRNPSAPLCQKWDGRMKERLQSHLQCSAMIQTSCFFSLLNILNICHSCIRHPNNSCDFCFHSHKLCIG